MSDLKKSGKRSREGAYVLFIHLPYMLTSPEHNDQTRKFTMAQYYLLNGKPESSLASFLLTSSFLPMTQFRIVQ